jgi:hypothetical protein
LNNVIRSKRGLVISTNANVTQSWLILLKLQLQLWGLLSFGYCLIFRGTIVRNRTVTLTLLSWT